MAIACVARKPGLAYCGRVLDDEFVFTDAQRAEAFYRRKPTLHPSVLTACEKCCDAIKQMTAEGKL